jgi:sigma-E factor negative regulatory protein RseB
VAGVTAVLGTAALIVLLVGPLGAPPDEAPVDRSPAAGGARPDVDPAARTLLERAAGAGHATSYEGTQFVSAWTSGGTTSQVLTVEHTPERGTTWRPVGGAASAPVHLAARSAEPSILGAGAAALLARHYSLARSGSGTVAGRGAEVVTARRPGVRGAGSLAGRFWLDEETGLVLRREVFDRSGRLIRASAYVDLTVASTGDAGSAAPGGSSAGGAGQAWRTRLDDGALSKMRRHGWHCPEALPGPLPLVDARQGGAGKGSDAGGSGGPTDPDDVIVHLSYADGLASISVFQQRGGLDGARLDGYQQRRSGERTYWVRDGVPYRVVWASGDTVYTVVADAPERTVRRAVRALHDDAAARGGDGAMDRLGRGLDRVGSWFNPFG